MSEWKNALYALWRLPITTAGCTTGSTLLIGSKCQIHLLRNRIDAKMTEYRLFTAEVARIEPNVNAVFVSIGVKSVIDAVAPECGQWLSAYDIALAEVMADEANKMDEDLTEYATDMMKEKKGRADLQFVFQVIQTATNESGRGPWTKSKRSLVLSPFSACLSPKRFRS